MELYFKDLISADASLEALVDDLSRIVQGADDYAKAIGKNVPEAARQEVTGRLEQLKQNCQRLKQEALAGARATDRMVRANPYPVLVITFAAGLVLGALWRRKD